jgi:hypothetical protein
MVTDGGWTANLNGQKVAYDGKTTFAPEAGTYTFVIDGNPSSDSEPGGESYGVLKVDKAGRIRASGWLADQTKISTMAVVSANGDWPLFMGLYAGKGCAIGWLNFQSTGDVGGNVNWSKAAMAKAPFYPGGFVVMRALNGSAYAAPPKGTPVLNLAPGQLVFEGGDLPQTFTEPIAMDTNSRVTDSASNGLSMVFKVQDGSFRGKLLEPQSGAQLIFGGVAVQKDSTGKGYFVGRGVQSGRVTLQ